MGQVFRRTLSLAVFAGFLASAAGAVADEAPSTSVGDLKARKRGAAAIKVRWKKPKAGADAYQVSYMPEDGADWREVTAPKRKHILTGLKPDTVYRVRVRARLAGVWSPWAEVAARTKP